TAQADGRKRKKRPYAGSAPRGLLWRQFELVRHSTEFGERMGLHLSHQIAAMHFHRTFGDTDVARNLLAEAALRDLNHDLPLAGCQGFETRPERLHAVLMLAAGAISIQAYRDGVEKVLVPERLQEELYRAALHRLHGHRDVAVSRDEDDRELFVGRGQLALKVETAF